MEEAYSHELSSAGFWAGAALGEAQPFTLMPIPARPVSARAASCLKQHTSTKN